MPGLFLEHAEVFGNSTARRASRLKRRCAAGHDLLLDIDVQGAAQVRAKMPEAVSIFVMPPNPRVLRPRLRNRSRAEGVVDEKEVFRRLSEARKEIENYREYGYILVNDTLDRAVAQLEAIVLAERFYRNGEAIAFSSRRVLEVAAACLQVNSQERLKPVLEAFGILGSSGQQLLQAKPCGVVDRAELDERDQIRLATDFCGLTRIKIKSWFIRVHACDPWLRSLMR